MADEASPSSWVEILKVVVDLPAVAAILVGASGYLYLTASTTLLARYVGNPSSEIRVWIAVASGALVVFGLAKGLVSWLKENQRRTEVDQHLQSVSPAENYLLNWCISVEQRTLYAVPSHPVVHGLATKGLLTTGSTGPLVQAFTIPPQVWNRLLFFAADNQLTAEERDCLSSLDGPTLLAHLERGVTQPRNGSSMLPLKLVGTLEAVSNS
jgi:hypothetical protein